MKKIGILILLLCLFGCSETKKASNIIYSIDIEEQAVSIDIDTDYTLKYSVNPNDAYIEWTSSNENIAFVVDGIVTSINYGKVTISAFVEGKTDSIDVTVEKKKVILEDKEPEKLEEKENEIKIETCISYEDSFHNTYVNTIQILTPFYGDNVNYNNNYDYKDFMIAEIRWNISNKQYEVTKILPAGSTKTNTPIPYDGYLLVVPKTSLYYDKYVSLLSIGTRITHDNNLLSNLTTLYCNKERDNITEKYNFDLSADYVSVYDATNDVFLYGKNETSLTYPASVTKITTALVAVKYCSLDSVFEVGTELDIMNEGPSPSTAGLIKGQKWTLRELLYALLLPSGNDAAYTIAVGVINSMDEYKELSMQSKLSKFYELMEDEVALLGATNTTFTSPDGNNYGGIRNQNHHTTAYDMCLITNFAIRCDAIAQVVQTIAWRKTIGDKLYSFSNTNNLVSATTYYYKYAIGVKTGTTTPAGYCLVTAAQKNERIIIVSLLHDQSGAQRSANSRKIYVEILGE